MTVADTLQQVSGVLAGHCHEPIGAALVVQRGPGTGGGALKRLFGATDVASRLRLANQLVLTPTHVRLFALGRSGLRVTGPLGAWPLGQLRIDARLEERSTYFASTGSSIDQHVFRLHLLGPGLDLTVDAMAYAGLDDLALGMLDPQAMADETDPDVREGMAGLQEMSQETAAMVAFFVQATGGRWLVPGSDDQVEVR